MRAQQLVELAATLEEKSDGAGICVSIALPTHRHAPDNQQDPIVLRQLIAEARQGIESWGLERDDRIGINEQLDGLESAVDDSVGWNYTNLGLACYLTPTSTTVVSLGHVPPRVVICGVEFHMASVIADISNADDIDVVVLSTGGGDTEGARLYHLERGVLTQVGDDLRHTLGDGADRRIHERGTNVERRRAEDFMRRFDDQLTEELGADHDRRIVLVGTRRLRDKWRGVARPVHQQAVIAEIEGNHDKARDSELVELVTAEVEAATEAQIRERIAALDGLATAQLSITNLDIAASAASGNLAELYVEEGSSEPIVAEGVTIDDRVANVIRAAWDVGAEIIVSPAGSLERYDGMVGVRRFTR